MTERLNPFGNLDEPSIFATKPKAAKPVAEETIDRIAEATGFPSRQASKSQKAIMRKPRRYRTGRNVQFNAKVTQETSDRIYKLVDERNVPIGEVLRLMAEALEREGGSSKSSSVPPSEGRKTPSSI